MKLKKKLNDHNHDKYITTREFNKLTADIFAPRLNEANLLAKTDFDDKIKSLNQKTNSSKTKLITCWKLIEKATNIPSIYFRGKSHFEEDGTQKNLVFQSMYRYFKRVVNSDSVLKGKSKWLSDESIKSPSAPYNFLNTSLNLMDTKTRVRFNESCLKQHKITYTHRKIVNIYIVYEINKNDNTSSDPTLENCWFGAASLAKNTDIDKNKYSGFWFGFDRHGLFHILLVKLVKI